MNQLISASLIYDGSGSPVIPPQLFPSGCDREVGLRRIAERQQMVGTPPEQLCEIAGRTCYDSLAADKSRSSAQYHPHILGVKHLSTVEHAAMTVSIHTRRHEEVAEFALMYLNRPNVWVRQAAPYDLRATVNLRHVLEWDEVPQTLSLDPALIKALGHAHRNLAHAHAPQIVGADPQVSLSGDGAGGFLSAIEGTDCTMRVIKPATDEEKWVSIFMTGSRGFSHEQVRHGDWTAISQRSTRFVNEAESKWVQHPLISAYIAEVGDKPLRAPNGEACELTLGQRISHVESTAQALYTHLVGKLQPWLEGKGVDKVTARKQARGAARGYLGNGLYTEVVFSASVSQWKRMTRQRLNAAADAEIREVYAAVLPVLKACAYGDSFQGMSMAPSPDGIGHVLVEA